MQRARGGFAWIAGAAGLFAGLALCAAGCSSTRSGDALVPRESPGAIRASFETAQVPGRESAPRSRRRKRKKTKKKSKTWARWTFIPSGTLGYHYNPLDLRQSALTRAQRDRQADKDSGRYDDIDSPDDIVLRAGVVAGLRLGAPGARTRLSFEPVIRAHTRNPIMSWAEFRFGASQELNEVSKVALDLDWSPTRFKGNGLAGAIDGDLNGSITDNERRYRALRYSSFGARVTYSLEYGEKPQNAVEFFIGGGTRQYRDVFDGRDRSRFEIGVDLVVADGKTSSTTWGYRFVSNMNRAHIEPLLLDEDDFSIDFNGDLDIIDQDVLAMQKVDRSTMDHHLGVEMRWKSDGGTGGRLDFGLRVRQWTSGEQFDRKHDGRFDVRFATQGYLTFAITTRGSLDVGVYGEMEVRTKQSKLLDKLKLDHFSGGLFARFGWRF